MKHFFRISQRILVFVLVSSMVAVLSGCKLRLKKKNTEESSQHMVTEELTNENSSDNLPLTLPIGETAQLNGLDFSIKSVSVTTGIHTGESDQLPEKGQVFVMAQIELVNHSQESYEFKTISQLIPSLDGQVNTLSKYINTYPNVIDGMDNLINQPTTSVFPEKPMKGMIIFEAPEGFSSCDFAFCSNMHVHQSFHFENPNGTPPTDIKPQKTAALDELTVEILNVHQNKEPEKTDTSAGSVSRSVTVTVRVRNDGKDLSYLQFASFGAEAAGKTYEPQYKPLYTTYLPPEKFEVQTLSFLLPADAAKFKLTYAYNSDNEPIPLCELSI